MDVALITVERPGSVAARAVVAGHAWLGAERGRLFLFLPVAMGGGVLVYFDLTREPSPWISACLVGVAAIVLALVWRWAVPRGVAALALAAALGFGRAQTQTLTMPPLLTVPHHGVTITGRVIGVDLLPTGRRISIASPRLNGGPIEARAVRVKLRRGDDVAVEAGDTVHLRALLYGASRPAYPGGWNFGRDQYFAGLGAVGFAISPLDVTARAKPGWLSALRQVREAIAARILADLPLDTGSIAATLLTGFEDAIPPAERQDFITAGLAHILAVAGLHIGIVMATLYALTRFIAGFSEYLLLRVPAKIVASIVSFAGGVVYAALTGFHVPIVRSLAMAALVLAGIIAGRRALSLRGLALAALALMLIEPQAVPGPSFQMSFSAVLALIAGYEAVGRRFSIGGESHGAKLVRHIAALAFTSFLAGGASMPFAAYHFQQIEPYYVLANLIAVPLTALVVLPLGMASLVLMPFHLEPITLIPMGWGIAVILRVARFVGNLPHALIEISPSPGYAVALVAIGLALLGLLRSRARYAGMIPIAAGLVAMTLGRAPDVLVSPTANLVGARDGGMVRIVEAGRVDKFTLSQWRPVWAGDPVRTGPADEVCDNGRCGFDRGRVLYLADRAAADGGCGAARVVVSSRPLRGACRKPGRIVIDRFSVWRNGAIGVWFDRAGVTVRTDRMVQGHRPWVPAWPARWHRVRR
ncbi:MAG: ComEC/Rec2 family competence protein [Acidiphilium sp.]|nr:ComEC/Rec2 family competence protein [Acidiphilium sp.]MDD4935974.1 ComEC/Rec2 family competence protein [Acidiphilium sp.]